MLNSLVIKNIALIDSLEVSFNSGLNVLSGETGAGKSIIIDSLNFVLGKRADKTLIRYGEDVATVTAFFNIEDCKNAKNILDEFEIENIDNELMIKRSMSVDGKNNCNINGQKVTLAMLKQLSSSLVDIYGQNDTTFLLNPKTHINIIDEYGAKPIELLKAELSNTYNKYQAILNKLSEYGSISDVAKNIDLYEYQIKEIEDAKLEEGEEEDLIVKRHKMNNSQSILNALNTSYDALNGDSEANVLSLISIIINELNKISEYDDSISDIVERLNTAKIDLKDISSTVLDIAAQSEFNQNEFDQIEERIAQIRLIKKKYGNTVQDVLNYFNTIREKYDFLTGGEKHISDLEYEKSVLFKYLYEKAIKLSKERQSVSLKLSSSIEKELNCLGIKNAHFVAQFNNIEPISEISDIPENGLDQMEFLFSANAGQPPRELAKIISGGELSRFMLALKNTIANLDDINTMVFDEIDSGISGNIAQVVAEKLYSISKNKQVLAITHLPQLAAIADNNYLIEKYIVDSTTKTSIKLLEGDALIQELARLIGGNKASTFAVPHAIEMKEYANSIKK